MHRDSTLSTTENALVVGMGVVGEETMTQKRNNNKIKSQVLSTMRRRRVDIFHLHQEAGISS